MRRVSHLGLASYLTPLGAIIILTTMAMTARQWADYDIYWHLANGRLMVEGGRFPSPDPFSWSAPGAHYVAFSAQVDRFFYLLWRAGGVPALGLASALLMGLTLLPYTLLVGRLRLRPIVEALALMLIVLSFGPFRGARPHAVAFVLCGLIVYLLESPFGLRRALVVGAALGLWANLHGSFQVGFGVVGAAGAAWALGRQSRAVAHAALALVLGFGLSLLSPYRIELWLYPLRSVSNPYLVYNGDWASLRPFTPSFMAMGLLLLAASAVGVWSRANPRALAALGLMLPSIQLVRFVPFAGPLLTIATLERLVERCPWLRLDPTRLLTARPVMQRASWGLLLVGGALLVPLAPRSIERAATNGVRPLPAAAVDRLLTCGEPAPVWNDYNWGGYLLWRGDGRYQIGMDGRAETVYGNEVFDRYYAVFHARPLWEAVIAASPAQYALMPADTMARIDNLPGWRRVFADDTATLSVRDGAAWRCDTTTAGTTP